MELEYQDHTDTHTEFIKRLDVLKGSVPTAPEPIRPLLSSIHRSALSLHNILRSIDIMPILPFTPFAKLSCFDCSTTLADSFHTSKQGGYHLCHPCFQHRVQTGRARTAH